MNERFQQLIDELATNTAMSIERFTAALNDALNKGELIESPLPNNRKQNNFLHQLAEVAPDRPDLIVHAAKVDQLATLNSSNIYGRTFPDILAHNNAWDSLRELADERVDVFFDTVVPMTHESAYRTALMDGPMSLVAAMEEHAEYMEDKGFDSDILFRDRLDRLGNTVFHDVAMRDGLTAQDFKQFLNLTADKIVGSDLKELLSATNHRGQTFFNVLVESNPKAANDIANLLNRELSAEEFDRERVFGGDPELGLRDRETTIPESTIPALQLARNGVQDGEALMRLIIKTVDAEKLHCMGTDGSTPLSVMASHGWENALESALNKGLDVNYGVDRGATNPVTAAISNTSRPDLAHGVLRQMVDQDMDYRWMREPNYNSGSIAKFAVDVGDQTLLSKALFLGADPDGHPASDVSPLRAAIEGYEDHPESCEPIIRSLIIHGASMKKVDMDMLSASERLQQPGMAAARDFAYRTAMIMDMNDRYGFDFAGAAVDGLTQASDPAGPPKVALGTLQLIPGVSRALNDKISAMPENERNRTLSRVQSQTDPSVNVMDLTNLSRALLAVPLENRQQMVYELEKLRTDLTQLSPAQLTENGVDAYRRQVTAINRITSWVRDSTMTRDGEWLDVSRLEADHARFIPRSMSDFADAVGASALLSPEVSQFPLAMSADGQWEATVSLTGDKHPMPRSGEKVSFLFANDTLMDPFKQIQSYRDGEAPVRTRGLLYCDEPLRMNSVNSPQDARGYVSFDNPAIYTIDQYTPEGSYNIDTQMFRDMGHDGVIVYDNAKEKVMGAIDLEGKKMEFPVGASVVAKQESAQQMSKDLDAEIDSPAPRNRGMGM